MINGVKDQLVDLRAVALVDSTHRPAKDFDLRSPFRSINI